MKILPRSERKRTAVSDENSHFTKKAKRIQELNQEVVRDFEKLKTLLKKLKQ